MLKYLKRIVEKFPNIMIPKYILTTKPPTHFFKNLRKLKDEACITHTFTTVSHNNYDYFFYADCISNLAKFVFKKELSYDMFVNIIFQTLIGFVFLQDNNIMHNDVKPQNIVACKMSKKYDYIAYKFSDHVWTLDCSIVNYNWFKIIDFGESKFGEETFDKSYTDSIHFAKFVMGFLWQKVKKSDKTEKKVALYSEIYNKLIEKRSFYHALVTSKIFNKLEIEILSHSENIKVYTVKV